MDQLMKLGQVRRRDILGAGVAGGAMLLAGGACAGGCEEVRTMRAPEPGNAATLQGMLDRAERAFASHILQTQNGPLPYRLLSPSGVRRAPMIAVLHGSGQIGDDNKAQLDPFAAAWADPALATRFPAFVAAPQVATRSANYAPDPDGQPAAHPGQSLAGLLELVDHLADSLPVDRTRIYLVGFSMGASTALQAIVEKPNDFAAVAAFSPVPPARRVAADVVSTPEMLVHGSSDTQNPFEADRLWSRALIAAGAKPRFIVYEGMDHRVPPEMILAADWRSWLFNQRRQPGAVPA